MFNLEQAIADWRQGMLDAGVKTSVPLDELESHLREDIGALVSAGKPEAHAFQLAVARLGDPGSVQTEFNKIKCASIRPVKIGSLLWIGATFVTAAFLAKGLFTGKLNLLLYAHVLSVTAGYGAVFLLGGFGICHVCYRSFHALSPVRQRSLSHAVHLFSHLAMGLVLVATMLGMIWSKQHWHRYWGWDPKEIGAVCVFGWLIAMVAMQRFQRISKRAVMLMCIGGNIIVSLAWFGAGIIVNNQRTPGYGMGHYWPLATLLVIQLCFLMKGLTLSHEVPES
jgi:hypothetical protein